MKKNIYIKIFGGIVVFLVMLETTVWGQNQAKIDSLNRVLQTAKQDTHRVNALLGLSKVYQIDNIDTASILAKQALDLANLLKSKLKQAESLHLIGIHYYRQYLSPEAIDYLKKSIALFQPLNRMEPVVIGYGLIGDCYSSEGEFIQALKYYKLCLDVAKKEKKEKHKGIALMGMGALYSSQKQYGQALAYYKQCLAHNQNYNIPKEIIRSLNAIGALYFEQKKYEEAVPYFQQALDKSTETNNKPGRGYALMNIGNAYIHRYPKELKGIPYYKQAQKIFEELNDVSTLMVLNHNIAAQYISCSMKGGDVSYAKEALSYNQKAIDMAVAISAKKNLKAFYPTRVDIEVVLRNFRAAYKYQKLAELYSDSLYNEDISEAIGKLEAQNEIEARIDREKRAKAAAAAAQKTTRQARDARQYIGITAGLAMLFSLGFVLRRRSARNTPSDKRRQRQNRLLPLIWFVGLLLSFEFLLIISEPYINKISGKAPIYELIFNVAVALFFTPAYRFFSAEKEK